MACLRETTRGALFVLISRSDRRAVAWRGGGVLLIYDLEGALLDTVAVPIWGGGAEARKQAIALLGRGVYDLR